MSFFPIRRYRVYDDPFDRFFGDQLDLFDPWRDLDTFPTALAIQPNAFRWVDQPQRLTSQHHRHAQPTSATPHAEKFRVQLNVAGFNPETINTKVEGRKVFIEAKQEDRQPDGDYNIRQLRKSYDLPEHADASRMASYITPNNMFVIEVPIQNPEHEKRLEEAKKTNHDLAQFGEHRDPVFDYVGFLGGSDFQPRIVDKGNNQKQLEMSVGMKNFRPQEIKVSVKNNELIVQGEHQHKDANRSERSFFYKSTILPPGTQVDNLQSFLTDDGQLKIEAPYVEQKPGQQSLEGQQQQTTQSIESQQGNQETQNTATNQKQEGQK
jgi:HSP20 family molecular chaperone IbpA